jgi:hypothetical protein
MQFVTAWGLLDISKIEPTLNAFDRVCQAVHAIGYLGKSHVHLGNFSFESADPLLHLAHVIAQAVDGTAYVPQMLKHDIVDVGDAGRSLPI